MATKKKYYGSRKRKITDDDDEDEVEEKSVDEILGVKVDEDGNLLFHVKWLPTNIHIVERIVAERLNSTTKKMEFLIKWKGYSEELNTWEDADNVNCKEKVGEYIKSHFHEFISDVVYNDDPNDTSADEDLEVEDEYKSEWIHESELNCPEEVKTFIINKKFLPEGKLRNYVLDKILGPVSRLNNGDTLYLVDWKYLKIGGVVKASVLEKKYPKKFLEYFEDQFDIIDHCKLDEENNRDNNRDTEDDDEEEEKEEYVVERVLDKRVDKKGKIEYLLKWLDYSEKESTWQSPDDLKCYNLICEFERSQCIGIQRNWKINRIISIKKTKYGQVYLEIEWINTFGQIPSFTQQVLYELAKQHFHEDILHFFATNCTFG